LEFAFLADWWLTERGLRDKTEIEFVTPLSGAFTKPVATRVLTSACEEKNIKITANFSIGSVDAEKKVIAAYDGTEVDYDLFVSIPPNFVGTPFCPIIAIFMTYVISRFLLILAKI